MKYKIHAIIATFILFCIPFVNAGDVMISQVLYDPINSETYSEALELYNPSTSDFDLSFCYLKTSSSNQDLTFPENTIIKSNSYFLATDTDFDNNKDNSSWPSPDYQESITLANSNAGVALICGNQTIDALGWGNVSNLELFETIPAIEVSSGHSLTRTSLEDTNINLLDFDEAVPNFHNSAFSEETQNNNEQGNKEIQILFNVNNSSPVLLNYKFLEDVSETDGYQVLPFPGKNKTLQLSVTVSDTDTTTDIKSLVVIYNNNEIYTVSTTVINQTSMNATFNLTLPYYLTPGTQSLTLELTDKSNEFTEYQLQFNYLSLIAFEIDSSELNFDKESNVILGDSLLSTAEKPTIQNTGNMPLDLGFSATDFSSDDFTLSSSILKYSFDENIETKFSMQNTIEVQPLGILPSKILPLNLEIEIPENSVKGTYTSKVSVTGVAQ